MYEGIERRKDALELVGITKDIDYIKISVTKIETLIENKYVPKSDFEPVRNIVYGMVGILLTGIVIAILTLVLRKP
jgi:hypothetical protein